MPHRVSLWIISSSFFRSASRISSFDRFPSERLPVGFVLRRALPAGSGRSLSGPRLLAISRQYNQISRASAQTISGRSTKRRMVLNRVFFFLFLLATLIDHWLLRVCSTQNLRRDRIGTLVALKTRSRISNRHQRVAWMRIVASRLSASFDPSIALRTRSSVAFTSEMNRGITAISIGVFLSEPLSNSACVRSNGWR